jgi:acetyl esterase
MTLHPHFEALRRELIAIGTPPLRRLTPAQARRRELDELRAAPGPPEPVAEVIDASISGPGGELPLRIFRSRPNRPQPVLVWFFGGGWVSGSLETAEVVCRRLANATPCAVVAVDYRLAPEHPFPAAVEDCYAATRWLSEHGADSGLDPRRLALGGASAGGNLAAGTALLARDRGGPSLALQLLVYPLLLHDADTASMREIVDPVLFDREDVAWCWAHYVRNREDGTNPLASPLRARLLDGLPPALVITAEFDPLRDEGELYAQRLRAAGVPAELVRFDGMAHGFFSKGNVLAEARRAQDLAVGALQRAFGAPESSAQAGDPHLQIPSAQDP